VPERRGREHPTATPAPSLRSRPASAPGVDLAALTPARVNLGRAGTSYPTSVLLRLRADHAAARDAVHGELDLASPALAGLVARLDPVEITTLARDRREYLLHPELGRSLGAEQADVLRRHCPAATDLQVVIGDGLSQRAVERQVPLIAPLLVQQAQRRGWSVGRPIAVRGCRVGVLNDIGAALDPAVVALLIGERPGLSTDESLSVYLAYRPRPGHTDADRNLVCNIHGRGLPIAEAAEQVLALAGAMLAAGTSGVGLPLPFARASQPGLPTGDDGLPG
jgi:ethanolamine ammonia-lyase small subunit